MIEKLENRAWKVLKSENILNLGPWLNVRQELVELPSGKQIPTWFVLDFPDWINVIAITKDGDFVMEDQYRHGLGETHYELVAGVIDPGETPLQAAQRELSEETGFGGGEWVLKAIQKSRPATGATIGIISGTSMAARMFIRTMYVVIPGISPPSLWVTTAAAVAVGHIMQSMALWIRTMASAPGNLFISTNAPRPSRVKDPPWISRSHQCHL